MSYFQAFATEMRFEDLCRTVQHCTLCPNLIGRDKILSKTNGDISTKVIFIAEAPGRLGADLTGIPLTGDRSGKNFETLLANIGWHREDIFITNAVLCNPREKNGNNRTPNSEEITNCATYIGMTVELVQPEVVVTLGAVALKALKVVNAHPYVLKEHVGQFLPWFGRMLIPLYHTGPRALIHRSLDRQSTDFLKLASFVDPKKGILINRSVEQSNYKTTIQDEFSTIFQQLIFGIVQHLGRMSYFKLTKLLYLTDLHALDRIGETLTGEIYLRQREGPWPPALRKLIKPLKGGEINFYFRGRTPIVEPGPSPRIKLAFGNDELEVIENVLDRYGKMSNAGIKMAVYRTRPMRYIREQEKLGRDMRNKPVIYENKTAAELDIAH